MSGYRSDTAVVHASALVAVPHRSQGVSGRHDGVDFTCVCDRQDVCAARGGVRGGDHLCLTFRTSSSWIPFTSATGLCLKAEWNSMGMLRRQKTMSALLFWLPKVLWDTLRHGGLSTVPSILVTYRRQNTLVQADIHRFSGHSRRCGCGPWGR